jgi:hypothetical protein
MYPSQILETRVRKNYNHGFIDTSIGRSITRSLRVIMPESLHLTFWPEPPWSPVTDAGDTPNLAAWNTRLMEAEDPGLAKTKQKWLKMNVSRDDDDDQETWHGAHFIFNGGQGSCGLFIKTDENDVIKDVSQRELTP